MNEEIMEDLMIDLETAGQGSKAAIISIGAVFFNMSTGEVGEKFYVAVNPMSSLHYGEVDGSTLQWWMKQSDEARAVWNDKKAYNLKQALEGFNAFISRNKKGVLRVWGNGVAFDNVILTNALNRLMLKKPWSHNLDMDVRTLVFLGKEFLGKDYKRLVVESNTGVAHNALDDCLLQIKYCSKIYQELNK